MASASRFIVAVLAVCVLVASTSAYGGVEGHGSGHGVGNVEKRETSMDMPPMAASEPTSVPYCVSHSNMSDCAGYQYPNPQGVMDTMCGMMDNMPACSVERRVCHNDKLKSSAYCAPFSLMSDVCTDMVMGVQGCKDFRQMCVPGNVVRQCAEPSLKAVLPTYMQTKSYVTGICTSMSMPDCAKCSDSKCDYLSVYSDLCLSMPDMAQCMAWKSLCKTVPNWPYCSMEESGIPQMRMYFHTGIIDFVLFQGWVPRNGVQYAFTWIAIAVAGVALEALKFLRAKLEKKWASEGQKYLSLQEDSEDVHQHHNHHHGGDASSSPSSTTLPWTWKVDIPRALLAGLELAWGYLLMLVAMTFNVGLFFAVIIGAIIGTLIFGRFLVTLPKQKAVSCH